VLSNALREQTLALEKTEGRLGEINEKLRVATMETSESNKLNALKAAVVGLRR
jgi:hypothetical protein